MAHSTAPYWSNSPLLYFTSGASRISSLLLAGWFTGLSAQFLAVRTARLLVLAGTDRLDKELMIGQMQGKFQMVVVPGVGHMLQEVRRRCWRRAHRLILLCKDDPTRLAEILVEFWRRNERVTIGVKKIGES